MNSYALYMNLNIVYTSAELSRMDINFAALILGLPR